MLTADECAHYIINNAKPTASERVCKILLYVAASTNDVDALAKQFREQLHTFKERGVTGTNISQAYTTNF